jgi:hypothetical protein
MHRYWDMYRFPLNNFKDLLTLFSKFCCIFPSRYLYAIGLLSIFSLGWNIPPVLGQHSQVVRLSELEMTQDISLKYGTLTLYGALFQGTC